MSQTAAQAFLERVQKQVYESIGEVPDYKSEYALIHQKMMDGMLRARQSYDKMTPQEVEEYRGILEREVTETLMRQISSKYQNPFTYQILMNLMEKTEAAIQDFKIPIPHRPIFGTLPTGRVNAMALLVPDTEDYIILFEEQIFLFAHLLSKALARALAFEGEREKGLAFSFDEQKVRKNIEQNPIALQRFREVVLAYLLTGKPGHAPQYFLEEPYSTLSSILLNSMELFILGHEYGHILRGHLAKDKSQTTKTLLGEGHVDEITRSWQDEIEADVHGVQYMIRAMQMSQKMDLALSFWGADFFFSCIEIVEQGLSILKTGQENALSFGSHPPAALRRESLREAIRRNLPAEAAESPIGLGKSVEEISKILWDETKPMLYTLHQQQKRPAVTWGLKSTPKS